MKRFDDFIESYSRYVEDAINGDIRSVLKERSQKFLIDEGNLSEEVCIQPATYSYIANLLAEAKRQRNVCKLEVKVVEASIKRRIKEENPKATVDATAAEAITHPDYVKAQADYMGKEAMVDHLEADTEACKQKSNMLQLLGTTMKRENYLKNQI